MSLAEESMMDLMAYADGELQGDELARVERLIHADPEAARMVEEFRTLSGCIQITEGARKVPSSVEGIADAVMARLPKDESSSAAPVSVVPEPKILKFKRAALAGTVSAALAMAAAWFLFFRGPAETLNEVAMLDDDRSEHARLAAPNESASAMTPSKALPELAAEDPSAGGVELEQVESPSREVSIFYVPAVAAAHASSVVVWIGESSRGGH